MRQAVLIPLIVLSGCAQLHHFQIGDIDNTVQPGEKISRFEVVEGALGLDAGEANQLTSLATTNSSVRGTAKAASDIFNFITFGPRTGGVVFNDTFADVIPRKIRDACPGGRVTALTVVRETAKYPIISGEIVRASGACISSSKEKP